MSLRHFFKEREIGNGKICKVLLRASKIQGACIAK